MCAPAYIIRTFIRKGEATTRFNTVPFIAAVVTYVIINRGIKSSNVKAGLAINPDTNWEVVMPFLDKLDIIVVMSVHPGFGGQKFISSALEKTAPRAGFCGISKGSLGALGLVAVVLRDAMRCLLMGLVHSRLLGRCTLPPAPRCRGT